MTAGRSDRCRICAAPTRALLTARDRNRAIDATEFHYRRCPACATVQLLDVPADLGRYYAGGYHGVPGPGEPDPRLVFERPKVELVRRHVAAGRVVEIGPSYGAFAGVARDAGFDVTAVEMDADCCAYLERTVGVRAICSDAPESVLPQLAASDAIVLWHAFEHLRRPLDVLEAAAANLRPGGVLAVAVPNPESLGLRLMGARWAHLDAPRHLTLVPLATLTALAAAAGLEAAAVVTTDPFALHCNRFAWEYALRRRPAAGPSSWAVVRASQVLERVMAPVERSGLRSAAYTLVARKGAG